MEKWHEIWYLECKEPVEVRVTVTVARELARYKLGLELKPAFSAVERPYWQKDDLHVVPSGADY
jgi:hypothetical protein